MTYYQRNNFSVSSHAICRAKQRIKEWNSFDDFHIRIKIVEFLSKERCPEFSKDKYDYYHFPSSHQKYLYFIVDNRNNLVISISPISHHKKINIFS